MMKYILLIALIIASVNAHCSLKTAFSCGKEVVETYKTCKSSHSNVLEQVKCVEKELEHSDCFECFCESIGGPMCG